MKTVELNFKGNKYPLTHRVDFETEKYNVVISKGKLGFLVSASEKTPTTIYNGCFREVRKGFQSTYGKLPLLSDLNEFLSQFDVKAVEIEEETKKTKTVELTEKEKSLKIKNVYNLNLKSNRVILAKRLIKGGKKTVLLNYGFKSRRVKVQFVESLNMVCMNGSNLYYELTLDKFIEGDFIINKIQKTPQTYVKPSSSTGWDSLEKLMNKTWTKK